MRYMIGKHVAPTLGDVPIAILKSGQVEALRDRKLADGYKVTTINNLIKSISVLYVWARKQGLYEGMNPTIGLRRTPPTGLIDYLCGDEVAKLLAYARENAPDVFPMIATAIYTGMRKGELFGLRWIDVLFDRGTIHVAVEVDGGRDYRTIFAGEGPLRWWANADAETEGAARVWTEATGGQAAGFDTLFRQPRSPGEYARLTEGARRLLVTGFPRLMPRDGDALRRLIKLDVAGLLSVTLMLSDNDGD